jgi:hypothetical protein
VVFHFFQVGVARESVLARDAQLLLRAEQLMQRRPPLRQLARDFANGTDFAGCAAGKR